MDYLRILKTPFFKLTFVIATLIAGCFWVHANETLAQKASRISFPGQTLININYTIRNLNLEKFEDAPHDLDSHQLKLISPFFKDKKTNLVVAITQSADDQLLFTVIKNAKVIQVQKINEISNLKISLQYGRITMNNQKPLVASTAASDIF